MQSEVKGQLQTIFSCIGNTCVYMTCTHNWRLAASYFGTTTVYVELYPTEVVHLPWSNTEALLTHPIPGMLEAIRLAKNASSIHSQWKQNQECDQSRVSTPFFLCGIRGSYPRQRTGQKPQIKHEIVRLNERYSCLMPGCYAQQRTMPWWCNVRGKLAFWAKYVLLSNTIVR